MAELFDKKIGKPIVVKIGVLDYMINWRDKIWRYETGLLGQIIYDDLVINLIEYPENKVQIASIFLHEITHGLLAAAYGLEDRKFDNEEIALAVENGLIAFWRDNPKTFAWWQALINGE